MFGTSNQLSVGPTIGKLTMINPSNFWAIASFVGLSVGLFSIVACLLLHMEFISRLISKTISTDFSTGAAIYITVTQLSKLIGIESSNDGFFTRLFFIKGHINEINLITLVIGIVAMTYLVLNEKYLSKLLHAVIIAVIPILLFFVDLS